MKHSGYDTFAKSSLIELKLNAQKPTQKAIIDSMKRLQDIIEKMTQQNRLEFDSAYHQARNEMKDNLIVLFQETWTKIKNLQ